MSGNVLHNYRFTRKKIIPEDMTKMLTKCYKKSYRNILQHKKYIQRISHIYLLIIYNLLTLCAVCNVNQRLFLVRHFNSIASITLETS